MGSKKWLVFALITAVSWGFWMALTALFANSGVPATLVYVIWAPTFILPCLVVLKMANWKLDYDRRSIILGCTVGLLGSGGQMLLFYAVTVGPAYLIYPITSLQLVVTIVLSMAFLHERTRVLGGIGIALALIALPLFEYDPTATGDAGAGLWFIFALLILAAWGVQAFFWKYANGVMSAESIFFYVTVTAISLIPIALLMTDFDADMDLSLPTVSTIAAIQSLNAIGALCISFAFRYGRAIVVAPLTNAGAPMLASIILIVATGTIPATLKVVAIVLALTAAALLAIEPEDESEKLADGE